MDKRNEKKPQRGEIFVEKEAISENRQCCCIRKRENVCSDGIKEN